MAVVRSMSAGGYVAAGKSIIAALPGAVIENGSVLSIAVWFSGGFYKKCSLAEQPAVGPPTAASTVPPASAVTSRPGRQSQENGVHLRAASAGPRCAAVETPPRQPAGSVIPVVRMVRGKWVKR